MPSLAPTRQETTLATAQIVEFALSADLPRSPSTANALRLLIADTVGVAIAGLATPPGRLMRDWIDAQAPPTGTRDSGQASAWGTDRLLSAPDAALLNGTLAHALDWDDAAPSMAMHPAAVLLPTLFALAGPRRPDFDDLDAAYSVGSAVFRGVSEVLPHAVHYGRGWHNTSTTGRLAATAAGARLVGLDPVQTAHALGIAASHAAGALTNFGTMTKPMHAGAAARDAVTAVGLAARGWTAHPEQLDQPGGFLDLYGDPDAEATSRLGERLRFWATGWTDDYAIKAHPSCFATQRAIDAGYSIRNELLRIWDDPAAEVAQISVLMEAGGTRPLRKSPPATGLEAKFSLEYTLALALVQGSVRLADFEDHCLERDAVTDLASRITLSERPASDGPSHTEVRLLTRDAQVIERTVHHARGESQNPLSTEALAEKFHQCVGDGDAERVWLTDLMTFASPDLNALLAGPAPRSFTA